MYIITERNLLFIIDKEELRMVLHIEATVGFLTEEKNGGGSQVVNAYIYFYWEGYNFEVGPI